MHKLLVPWLLLELAAGGGWLFITADHGNAEQLFGAHGERDTQHNPNPVPFLICCASKDRKLKVGTLADVAPTILAALFVSQPDDMKGRNLLSCLVIGLLLIAD